MDLSSGNENQSESRFDAPDLVLYHYMPVDSSIYSIGIKNLEETALARDLAKIRLKRLLQGYSGKRNSNR